MSYVTVATLYVCYTSSMVTNTDIPKYIKASKKQEEYLAWLYPKAGEQTKSLYSHYTMRKANSEIGRLQRKLVRRSKPRQMVLL